MSFARRHPFDVNVANLQQTQWRHISAPFRCDVGLLSHTQSERFYPGRVVNDGCDGNQQRYGQPYRNAQKPQDTDHCHAYGSQRQRRWAIRAKTASGITQPPQQRPIPHNCQDVCGDDHKSIRPRQPDKGNQYRIHRDHQQNRRNGQEL